MLVCEDCYLAGMIGGGKLTLMQPSSPQDDL